jgi:holo-[acyl-carrier protein] synthase
MAIAGHGIDVVDVERFTEKLQSTPSLRDRLFAPGERELPDESLAARFAAKEALIKALGSSDGISWVEIEIPRDHSVPTMHFSGATADTVAALGLRLHLSMSHDGGIAVASVIAEHS